MPLERCPRCGTPRTGDRAECVRCGAPFEVTADDVDLALPRPAAPSPTQSHGTVMAALLSGFVLLAVLLWWSVRDVGPFEARLVGTEVAGGTAHVTLTIENRGGKAGHGKCRVARLSDETGDFQQDFQFLSERVPGHRSIVQTVDVPLPEGQHIGPVNC
jgi:hypothetical protein